MDARESALRKQLAQRPAGAQRVGWKLGMGERERIDGKLAVGHLTTATLLEPGATYTPATPHLHADVELAVEIGAGRYAVALELVDLARPPETPEDVVAENIFHRAVAFGAWRDAVPANARARATVNGVVAAEGEVPDVSRRLVDAATLLRKVGEDVAGGDRVITGSIVQVPVRAGDEITAAIDGLGEVRLHVAR